MSDIECVLRVADAIMADRLVLLRYVRRSPGYWTEVTHCLTFDALVSPDDPALLPPRSPALVRHGHAGADRIVPVREEHDPRSPSAGRTRCTPRIPRNGRGRMMSTRCAR